MQPDTSYGNFIIEESLIIRGLEPESNGVSNRIVY